MGLRRANTLIEILIVVAIVAVLASIAVPKFSASGGRSKEATLRAMLREIRAAGDRCEADTGVTVTVSDLAQAKPPASGWARGRMNTDWTKRSIDPSTWRGPYLEKVPINPFNGNNTYQGGRTNSPEIAWTHYSRQSFNPSYYYFPSTARASDGTQFRTW